MTPEQTLSAACEARDWYYRWANTTRQGGDIEVQATLARLDAAVAAAAADIP
jgi:hypothetical protein